MDDFSDIIERPHHVSATHRQMPLADRAAQFSAFAALTGYDEDIDETARLTTAREALAEDDLAALDAAFQRLLAAGSGRPAVAVRYFQPDARKEGGRYVMYTGVFRHYDAEEEKLYFEDASVIPAEQISGIVFL